MCKLVRKLLSIAAIFLVLLALSACRQSDDSSSNQGGEQTSITIECDENLVFSRYDVAVYVDDEYVGVLDHGATETFDLAVSDGNHVLRLTKDGETDVDGHVEFYVDGSTTLKYKVHCTASQVEIETVERTNPPFGSDEVTDFTYEEAREAFEEAGFSDVTTEEVRDLSLDERDQSGFVTGIAIGGSTDFSGNEACFSDAEVVITYHVLSAINPPASSSSMEGMDYEEVVSQFEDAGFSNVSAKASRSTGPVGTVEEVRIGGWLGSTEFSVSDTFDYDAEVEVFYFDEDDDSGELSEEPTDSVPESDLNALLTSSDTNAEWFSSRYLGRTITFDAYVAAMSRAEGYDTLWNVLILAGNSGESPSLGPNFEIVEESMLGMHVAGGDILSVGDNITITATVGSYDETKDWLEINPVSISMR